MSPYLLNSWGWKPHEFHVRLRWLRRQHHVRLKDWKFDLARGVILAFWVLTWIRILYLVVQIVQP